MSVLIDLYKYVVSDTALAALLGATSENNKIYLAKTAPLGPDGSPTVPPHVIIYRVGEGSPDEIMDMIRIACEVTVGDLDAELVEQIADRLDDLLHFKKYMKALDIPSTDYYIKDSEHNGGTDDTDNETKQVIKINFYDVKYYAK